MAASPNVLNYQIGKADVYFTPDGAAERHVGNCAAGGITPNITFLDHFSSMSGTRTKDRSVATEIGGTMTLTMEEITPENLSILLFGGTGTTVATNSDGDKEFNLFDRSEITGQFRIVGTNDIGNKFTVTLPKVSVQPQGEYGFISDEWNQVELSGEVLQADSGDFSGLFGTVVETEVAA